MQRWLDFVYWFIRLYEDYRFLTNVVTWDEADFSMAGTVSKFAFFEYIRYKIRLQTLRLKKQFALKSYCFHFDEWQWHFVGVIAFDGSINDSGNLDILSNLVLP